MKDIEVDADSAVARMLRSLVVSRPADNHGTLLRVLDTKKAAGVVSLRHRPAL